MGQEHSPLQDARVNTVLDRLHKQANGQLPGVITHILGAGLHGLITRKPTAGDVSYYRDKLISIDRKQGDLIYLLCRGLQAKRIVEYGTSFGVSTLYLASAVRDNGGGTVIGTELEPNKVRIARANFEAAGLSEYVDLREGDALETLKNCGGPVDFLLVDGWPKLARDIAALVTPQMHRGAMMVCDGAGHTKADRDAYLGFIRDPANGLISATLPGFRGTEITVKV